MHEAHSREAIHGSRNMTASSERPSSFCEHEPEASAISRSASGQGERRDAAGSHAAGRPGDGAGGGVGGGDISGGLSRGTSGVGMMGRVLRGTCGACGQGVFSDEARSRDQEGTYLHATCHAATATAAATDNAAQSREGPRGGGGGGGGGDGGGGDSCSDDGFTPTDEQLIERLVFLHGAGVKGTELTQMALEDFNSVPVHCIPALHTRIRLLQDHWGLN